MNWHRRPAEVKEVTMEGFYLELNTKIYATLSEEAERLGISPAELVRYILGERFSPRPTYIAPLGGVIGSPVYKQPESIVTSMYKLLTIQGLAKCPKCTQSLSLEDIKAGRCIKCEAEIALD